MNRVRASSTKSRWARNAVQPPPRRTGATTLIPSIYGPDEGVCQGVVPVRARRVSARRTHVTLPSALAQRLVELP